MSLVGGPSPRAAFVFDGFQRRSVPGIPRPTIEMTVSTPLIHGPIRSSRFGRCLLLDVTAPQNNMVVARGSSLARSSVLVTTFARQIIELSKAGEKLDSVAILGSDGDPVRHPDLREITENVRSLRDKWFPRAKLCLQTALRDLNSFELRTTVGMYDKVFLEYEWGTAKTFASMTGEKSTQLGVLTRQLMGVDHLIVQASFMRGPVDNSTDSEVQGWIKKLQEFRPREVHILANKAGSDLKKAKNKAVTKARRQEIADEVAEKTGIAVSIHEDEATLV